MCNAKVASLVEGNLLLLQILLININKNKKEQEFACIKQSEKRKFYETLVCVCINFVIILCKEIWS